MQLLVAPTLYGMANEWPRSHHITDTLPVSTGIKAGRIQPGDFQLSRKWDAYLGDHGGSEKS
jgi:hypothetical protein